MSVREAASRLGVHDNTVRRYADRGLIRAVRLPSGVRRLQREDVEALAPQTVEKPDAPTPPTLEDLAAPEVWPSEEDLEEFLVLTYSERDRDR